MRWFAKAFVLINRLFGAFVLLGGVAMLLMLAVRIAVGLPVANTAWIFALIAVGLILIGVIYLRAPLSRKSIRQSDSGGGVARIVTLRDFLLLVAAVVVGLLLYKYLSGFTADLSISLWKWLGLHTEMQYRILDTASFALTAIVVGALLVLITTPLAQDPHRLALYLAISLPLVYLIGITFSQTYLHSLREAIVVTIRIFAIVGLAFAAGCLLASRLLLRGHSRPQ